MLRLVEEAVEDWAKMQQRAGDTIAELTYGDMPADRRDEAEVAAELLAWLAENHFTFLGYREYTYQPADQATGTRHVRGRARDRAGHPARRRRQGRCLPRAAGARASRS